MALRKRRFRVINWHPEWCGFSLYRSKEPRWLRMIDWQLYIGYWEIAQWGITWRYRND